MTLMELLQSIFVQPKPQCIKCGKVQGETPFDNRTDEVCFVCKHYSHSTKFTCCRTAINLYHGEPEMCPDCGKEIISFGASITTGNPHLTRCETQGQYIVKVYYHQDGPEKYLKRKIEQSEKIKDKNIRDAFILYYQTNCGMTKALKEKDREYYR